MKRVKGLLMSSLILVGTLALAFNIQLTKAEDDLYDILDEREGFGRNTYGGRYGTVYHVTSLADSGNGTLRAAAESDDPLWIVFDVSGTIHLNNEIIFRANKTIDGRGAYVTITGYGFKIQDPDVSNVIVTNLFFDTGNKDAIRTNNGAHDLWIHHCDFTYWGDGCIDITEEATNVTVSWCRFWNHNKVMLIGSNPEDTGDVVIRVTLHHNFFNGTTQRHPRLRFGKVDAYNNYLYNWGDYGMGVAMYGQLLVEANIFEAGSDNDAVITSVGSDPASGYSKLVNNLLENGAVAHENEPEQVFNRSTYYTATIETANNILKWKIMSKAGAETHITAPHPPEASFTYTPSNPIINQTVTFNASASLPGWNGTHTVPIANYTWDFGDENATTTTEPVVTHQYTTNDTYTVTLTVTCEDDPVLIDKDLTTDSVQQSMTVYPLPYGPKASFTYTPTCPSINQTVAFNASTSSPGWNGTHTVPIANYTWDFGDENVTATSAPTITHKYVAEGVYNVTLNVTDTQGLWNFTSKAVSVYSLAMAGFTVTLPYGASALYPGWGAYPEEWRQIRITVTVENRGPDYENFTVTTYYDDQLIHDYYGDDNQTVTNLAPGNNVTLTFHWDTGDVSPQYTRNIYVKIPNPALGDIEWQGNTATVRRIGDCNCDFYCKSADFTLLAMSWWLEYPDPYYDWRCDFNGDGDVKGEDFTMLAMNWYEY